MMLKTSYIIQVGFGWKSTGVTVQRRADCCCSSGAIQKEVGEPELPKAHHRLETEIGVASVQRRRRLLVWSGSWSRERRLEGSGLMSSMPSAGEKSTISVCASCSIGPRAGMTG